MKSIKILFLQKQSPMHDTMETTPLLTTIPSETTINPPIEPTMPTPTAPPNIISPPSPINITSTAGNVNEAFINTEAKQVVNDVNQATGLQGMPTIPTYNPATINQTVSHPMYSPVVSVPAPIPTFSAGYHVPNQPNPYSLSSRIGEQHTAVSYMQPTLVFDPALAAKSAQELLGKDSC